MLYRVKATYKYNKEDVDELSFEVGEVISVVEYDDPEEQVNTFFLLFHGKSRNLLLQKWDNDFRSGTICGFCLFRRKVG